MQILKGTGPGPSQWQHSSLRPYFILSGIDRQKGQQETSTCTEKLLFLLSSPSSLFCFSRSEREAKHAVEACGKMMC